MPTKRKAKKGGSKSCTRVKGHKRASGKKIKTYARKKAKKK